MTTPTERALAVALAGDGWLRLPLLDGDDVTDLRTRFDRVAPRPLEGFWTNVMTGSSAEDNLALAALVGRRVWHRLGRLLPSWRLAFTSFVAKGTAGDSRTMPHQDWSMVDERVATALNAWIPLVDVDPRNGCLEVVPGSHLLFPEPRGLTLPSPCLDFGGPVEPHLRPVRMQAGEVLLYPHQLVHGSRNNDGPDDRPAVALALVPVGATFTQHWIGPDTPPDQVELFEVDETYFYAEIAQRLDGSRPRRPSLGTAPRLGAPLSADEMLARIRSASPPPPDVAK